MKPIPVITPAGLAYVRIEDVIALGPERSAVVTDGKPLGHRTRVMYLRSGSEITVLDRSDIMTPFLRSDIDVASRP